MKNLTAGIDEYWNIRIASFTLDKGYLVEILLRYFPYMKFWTIDVTCEQENFKTNGIRITNTTNLLRDYSNFIDFDIMCISKNKDDPFDLNSFSSGNHILYLLSEDEKRDSEKGLYDSMIINEEQQ